jgi:Domain of unknown function (DUF4389)
MPYPVSVSVEPVVAHRNRLTTAFRLVLAIPHLILVGGVGFSVLPGNRGNTTAVGGETGLLGAVVFFLAVISWFTILFSGSHIVGIRQFTHFYMRWRVRALSYLMLLEDPYPPFGDALYPASISIVDPTGPRDRLTVAVRILLGIPHFIVLFFLIFAWWLTTLVAWFAILLTGEYPARLHTFGTGVLRWFMRVEAYMLLLVDDYPPFQLGD